MKFKITIFIHSNFPFEIILTDLSNFRPVKCVYERLNKIVLHIYIEFKKWVEKIQSIETYRLIHKNQKLQRNLKEIFLYPT